MKITDESVLKSLEKELIDSVVSDLNWEAIEKVFKDEHNLVLQDDVEYKHGDLVVHNNQLAYKFDFEVKVMLSVILYRDGNYLLIKTPVNHRDDEEPPEVDKDNLAAEPAEQLSAASMAEADTGRAEQVDPKTDKELAPDIGGKTGASPEPDGSDASKQITPAPVLESEASNEPEDNPETEEHLSTASVEEAEPGKIEQVDKETKQEPDLDADTQAEAPEEKDSSVASDPTLSIPDQKPDAANPLKESAEPEGQLSATPVVESDSDKPEQVTKKADIEDNSQPPKDLKEEAGSDFSDQITTEIEIEHMVDKVIVEEALAELSQEQGRRG